MQAMRALLLNWSAQQLSSLTSGQNRAAYATITSAPLLLFFIYHGRYGGHSNCIEVNMEYMDGFAVPCPHVK